MNKLALLAAFLLLSLAPRPTLAESPRGGSFWLDIGNYRPNIDAEFQGAATPYKDIFGTGRGLVFRVGVAKSLFTQYGALELGGGIGWFSKGGKGFIQGTTTPSGDSTQLRILPLSLNLTYRFDLLADRIGFPFVPYARASLERWQWWVTNGSGSTASQLGGGRSGSGATNGWSGTLGVAFLLDYLDPGLAREMDRDTGINHTLVYVQATRTKVDDFGSKKSWDLSDEKRIAWSGGLMFVF